MSTPHSVQAAQASPAATFLTLLNGYRLTQMIYVAAKLGIADLLASRPMDSEAIAAATGTHAPSLYRLLRTLASYGIFAEDEQGCFGLTPMAELLQTGVPGSFRPQALLFGDTAWWHAWGTLLHTVQTGETGFMHVHSTSLWEYLEQHPEKNAMFNTFMAAMTKRQTPAIVAAYDFSGIHTLVDVAGGLGELLTAILKANPTLHGILFEQAHVVPAITPLLESEGVLERCTIMTGNMFEALPEGYDAYLLKYIIHDWYDEEAGAILSNCRKAIPAHGRLLLVEYIITPGNNPHPGKLLDMQMMVSAGGKERTEKEFRTLLAKAGFSVRRILPTAAELSIIEAIPA